MTVAQSFPRFAGRLACFLALSCATILGEVTPVLFAADEAYIAAESDKIAGGISPNSDSALPAIFTDSFDEQLKLTGDWFGVRDQWANRGVTLDTNLTQFYQGVASGGKEQTSAYGG